MALYRGAVQGVADTGDQIHEVLGVRLSPGRERPQDTVSRELVVAHPVDLNPVACGEIKELVNTKVFEECALVGELMGEGAQLLRRCVAAAEADDSIAFHVKMLS